VGLDDLVFAATDPRGRLVVLTRERLDHIRRRHPELVGLTRELLQAVQAPDDVMPGAEESEEWVYLSRAGPARWLKVVIAWDPHGTGRIITAFPRRAKP
jgi:hypothetical protein